MRVKVVARGVVAPAGAAEHRRLAGRVGIQVLAAKVHPEHVLVIDEMDDDVVDVLVHGADVEPGVVPAVEPVGEDWHQEDLRLGMLRHHLLEDQPDALGDVLGAVAGVAVVVDVLLVAVVHADEQREVFRLVAVERAVPDAPEKVLDAVAADAHVDRLGGVPVEAQVRVDPEVGDGVAEQDGVEALARALPDVVVEVGRAVFVRALRRRARFRRRIRARHLDTERIDGLRGRGRRGHREDRRRQTVEELAFHDEPRCFVRCWNFLRGAGSAPATAEATLGKVAF